MSIRRVGNRWQVRLRVGGDKRVEQTLPRGATRRDAQALEAQIRRNQIDCAVGRKPAYLIDDAIDRWVETAAKHLKSWERDLKYRVDVLRTHTAGRPLADVPEVAEVIKTAGMAAGLLPPTINRLIALLRRIGNLAERWGWTDAPLGRRVSMLPENSRRDVYLSPAQVRALVAQADSLTGDMIWFAVLTGLRRGEMLALRRDQLKGDILALESTTKTGRPRSLPLPPRAARMAAKRLPWGVAPHTLRDRFEEARRAAGLPHVHWHDLRHTYASWLAQAGQPMGAIRDLMGHSSLAVTNRYAHLAPSHLRAAVASLPGGVRVGKKSSTGGSAGSR
jgi:integrase